MADEPITLNSENFKKIVLESELPVIVDFWAPWCGPCKLVGPHLEALAKELSGKIIIGKLNTDDNPKLAGDYQISGIPTLMIFQKGKEVDRIVGAIPKEAIKEKVDPYLV